MVIAADEWRRIRVLRADPPALAGADSRRRAVFQAALAQSEELWEAAAAVGATTRALPLFYSLSQATRAICAAWLGEDEWQPRTHGLRRAEPQTLDEAAFITTYGCRVPNHRRGAFSMLARAVASPVFEGVATTAQLWASLPDMPGAIEVIGDLPRCLALEATRPTASDDALSELVRPTRARLLVRLPDVNAILAHYPTATGFRLVNAQFNPTAPIAPYAVAEFPGPDGQPRPLSEIAEPQRRHGATLGPPRGFLLRPAVGAAHEHPPTQLLTLWALLFNLSELTRYYPDSWSAALNPDQSRLAVAIDHGLAIALELVPHLVASGLRGPIDTLLFTGESAESRTPPPDDAHRS